VRAVAALVALVLVLVALAEVATRTLLDDAVASAAAVGLARASRDGQGFADVSGDARGWAIPDLVRGRLSGVDVVAVDGDLAGLPVRRLTATAGAVDLRGRDARDVVVVATADPGDLLAPAGELVDVDLSGGTVAPAGPDLLRFSGDVGGTPVTADLRLAPDGAGGLLATVESVTSGGEPVPDALLPSTGALVVRAEELPAGFAVESATVRDVAGEAQLEVALRCPGECDLDPLSGLSAGDAVTVPL
jgi:hypothetical protein